MEEKLNDKRMKTSKIKNTIDMNMSKIENLRDTNTKIDEILTRNKNLLIASIPAMAELENLFKLQECNYVLSIVSVKHLEDKFEGKDNYNFNLGRFSWSTLL